MLTKELADKLTTIAQAQLKQGLEAKSARMKAVSEIYDLYNNKILELDDENIINIPFPFLAGLVDLLFSKIDNPPTLTFKIPNRKALSDKVQAAWTQEMNSTKAGWRRKDRAEKKIAVIAGRGVAKIYASSFNGKYRSHYDVVDVFSFVADAMHGDLEAGNYHGETDIFKTTADMQLMVDAGIYDKGQFELLKNRKENIKDGEPEAVQYKFDRLKALGVNMEMTSFAGQEGVNLTEWIMRYEGDWYYLLFDPKTAVWLRAELLKDVFENGRTPYVSWATHYEEFSFWTKGLADDIYPIAEAMRMLLNMALENEKRRGRPMRIVDAGALVDVNELQDYVPDNVILRNTGIDPNLVTIETPEITTTVNLVEYLDSMTQNKSGVSEPGVEETDAKVGVYFGELAREQDRIGAYNKEYSESYAHKGYRFFWGLKEHLHKPKQIEMLGQGGIKLHELSKFDFKDVEDVDDVLVSGGSREEETTAIENEAQAKIVTELATAYPNHMNPEWVIRSTLRRKGFEEEEINQALDLETLNNRESIETADSAIQDVLLGNTPNLNMAADPAFGQRIIDYVRINLNYVKLDTDGNEVGIDKDLKQKSDKLLKFVEAHRNIMLQNMVREKQKQQLKQMGQMSGMLPPDQAIPGKNIDMPQQTEADKQKQLAQPFETPAPAGTKAGTAQVAANASQALTP